jgi:NADH:ubiquinone oxidoreductase subunit 2 (subunit N)
VKSPLLTVGVFLMLVNILISIVYYFRIIRIVVFSKPSDLVSGTQVGRASVLMIGPAVVLIVLSLITGLVPQFFYAPAVRAIQVLMGTT